MKDEKVVEVVYRNHRGEIRVRKLLPVENGLWFGATTYHPEQQWFIRAIDVEKPDRPLKDFALLGFRGINIFSPMTQPPPVIKETK